MSDLTNNYDQSMILTQEEEQIFNDVSAVVKNSLLQADPQPAFSYGRNLRRTGQLTGLALSKLLAELDKNWELFQKTGIEERIEDIVFVEMGISPQTTRKYIRLWDDIFENPDIAPHIRSKLLGKPIKSLLLLPAAARDGDDIDWEKVANSENGAEIRDLVREARGPNTSSESSIRLMMDRDGTLYAKKGSDPERHVLGTLKVLQMITDPIVEKGINRIVERSSVLWL